MNYSAVGKAVTKYFEQCVLFAYPDPGSPLGKALQRAGLWLATLRGAPIPHQMSGLSGAPWTMGWGDTGPDVVQGATCTQVEADERFERRIREEFEPMTDRALTRSVTQGQYDATLDLLYNVGPGRQGRDGVLWLDPDGRPSTYIRKLNAGDDAGAAEAYAGWNRSGGTVSLGLRRRRAAFLVVYRGGDAEAAIEAANRIT